MPIWTIDKRSIEVFMNTRLDDWKRPPDLPGYFIPPFVDVMVPEGPAFVWFKLVGDLGGDLGLERCGVETWAEEREVPLDPEDPAELETSWDDLLNGIITRKEHLDHEWLQEEVGDSNWDTIFYDTQAHYGDWSEWSLWALECGIATGQPFLIRIEPPHYEYSSSYYDGEECDVEWTYDIVRVLPMSCTEVVRCWEAAVAQPEATGVEGSDGESLLTRA